MPAAVSARGLTKHFGDVHAVDELDLEIVDGEFFSMLGPSGSGKTTVLRLIAGFEQPTSGSGPLACVTMPSDDDGALRGAGTHGSRPEPE